MAYFLRRAKSDYLILDDSKLPGGSWNRTWEGLKLFSPSEFCSLSGWRMPKSENEYPTKDEFIDYLNEYDKKYEVPIVRPVKVKSIVKSGNIFEIETDKDKYRATTVVSATGTAQCPYIPEYPNQVEFTGEQVHSVDYRTPLSFAGQKVLIIGGGNSGAQVLAEISLVAEAKWVTLEEPNFLPKEIDGRYLFNQATAKYQQMLKGEKTEQRKASLSDIVMVESVRDAEKRGDLKSVRPFKEFYSDGVVWNDGEKEVFDTVVWCTGFKANLEHLKSLNIVKNGRIRTKGTQSVEVPGLWLLGYGNWTGYASATIYGVGKTARETAKEITSFIDSLQADK
jgi:cation diffusion facilitator CzcD-associated flavoprotein CzcO